MLALLNLLCVSLFFWLTFTRERHKALQILFWVLIASVSITFLVFLIFNLFELQRPFLALTLFVMVVVVLIRFLYETFAYKPKTKLDALRKDFRIYQIKILMLPSSRSLYISPYTRDKLDIIIYDSKIKRGWTRVPLPLMRTQYGQEILDELLEAYREERPKIPNPRYPTWRCICGRENQHYVSTCVCGINKQDLQKRKYDRQ